MESATWAQAEALCLLASRQLLASLSAAVPRSGGRRGFHRGGQTKRGLWAAGTACLPAFPLIKSDSRGLSEG